MIKSLKRYLALRRLEADRAMRLRMIGAPYAKRRAAALKGVGR